jgi:hypothetical protein
VEQRAQRLEAAPNAVSPYLHTELILIFGAGIIGSFFPPYLSTGTSFKIGAGVIAKTQPAQDFQPYLHANIQVTFWRWTNRYDLRGIAFLAPTDKSDWTYSLALE